MKIKIKRSLQLAFIVIVIILILFPIYWMVQSSFKEKEEIMEVTFYPHKFTTSHYGAMATADWARAITNSVGISLLNTAICLLAAFPAAYAFTRFRFKADTHLFFWFIVNRLAPPAAFLVPFFIIFLSTGLYDTILAVVLAHSLFNVPLGIWILSGFMTDIPTEVDEAAFIDGHSRLSFFRRILFPLMRPAIGVTAFFLWMFSWTEMLLASAVTRNIAFPLTVQLLVTRGSLLYGVLWGEAAAAGVISMIPGIILLIFVRRYITRGFMLGRI